MGIKVGELFAEIRGDRTKLKGDLTAAKGDVTRAAGDMEHASKKAFNFGGAAAGIGVGVGAFVAGAKVVTDAWSSQVEATNKVGVVFGEMAGEVNKFAEGSSKALGISKTDALQAAGTFGNLFRAMGLTTDVSKDMSLSMITLASDLASFNDANPEDVLAALKSGLVGETEPLRAFGVNLNEARIKGEAFRLGLAKTDVSMVDVEGATIKVTKAQQAAAAANKKHGAGSLEARDAANKVAQAQEAVTKAMAGSNVELDAGQKAQAAYSLIMQDTVLAQGDFANTIGSAANQQRILNSGFDDTKAKLGESLAPLANFTMSTAIGALDGFNSWWAEKGPGIKEWIKTTFGEDPGASFREGVDKIKGKIEDLTATDSLLDDWKNSFNLSIEDFRRGLAGSKEPIDAFKDGLRVIGEFLDGLWNKLTSVGDWFRGDNDAFTSFRNGLDILGSGAAKVAGLFGFDEGGVVPGPKGAAQLAMVHGGETILPTHKQSAASFAGGSGGVTNVTNFTFHVAPGATFDRAAARQLGPMVLAQIRASR